MLFLPRNIAQKIPCLFHKEATSGTESSAGDVRPARPSPSCGRQDTDMVQTVLDVTSGTTEDSKRRLHTGECSTCIATGITRFVGPVA